MLIIILAIISGGVVTYAKHWLAMFTDTPQPIITEQLFSVVKGDTSRRVISRLAKQGMIDNEYAYRAMLLQEPALGRMKIGQYRVTALMTPRDLFTLLSSGVDAQFTITLVEGTSFSQWLDIVNGNTHISVSDDQTYDRFKQPGIVDNSVYPNAALEGMFFPDTYHFSAGSNVNTILTRANDKLRLVLEKHWQTRQKNLPLSSPYQALVLASIIEKETAIASERKTIASVFVNRLRKRMRLQTDPTVIYGAGASYDGDITRAHLRDKNPYNTYRIKGLPPTPIAMVSEQAIIAALQPSNTPYLYFVAAGDGGHYFSKTLKEHNKAVRRYLALSR